MFLKPFLALFYVADLGAEWDLHFGAHNYWREEVFRTYNVTSCHDLLNLEPANTNYYGTSVPRYFKSWTTTQWIVDHYQELPHFPRVQAEQVLQEFAYIFAAEAMCYPRDRVGRFDWSDVVRLHETLGTPFHRFRTSREAEYLDF
jgi:hypothetical protein